jgi:dTMP kinase
MLRNSVQRVFFANSRAEDAVRTGKGRLIVIEGSDGSGKATQSRALVRRLRAQNIPAARIAFPGYRRAFFGRMVGEYLRGELGAGSDPRLVSLLYAGDRWEAKAKIVRWLAEGRVVVCDRYVDSNKAHQGARLRSPAARGTFLEWVDRLEHGVFELPRPDFTIFLHVPQQFADRLIASKAPRAYLRGKRRDIHESDPRHLRDAERIYLRLASSRPARQGALIECTESGRLLSKSQVAERIWRALVRRGLVPRPS